MTDFQKILLGVAVLVLAYLIFERNPNNQRNRWLAGMLEGIGVDELEAGLFA